jgi:TPR repeat protein
MKKIIRLTVLIVSGVVLLGLILMVLRNLQFEAGVRALKAGDYQTALSKLRPLAFLGDGPSQYAVGEMYAFGFGVQKDDEKAIYWFRRAAILAQRGVDPAAPAELSVSRRYAEGVGIRADAEESLRWLQRAAAGGSKEAIRELQDLHK